MLRVTSQNLLDFSRATATSGNADIARVQRQITSGTRIARPSDHPVGHAAVVTQRQYVTQWEVRTESIKAVRDRLTTNNQHLLDARSVLERARELTLEARQTTDLGALELLAREVDRLLGQLTAISNATTAQGPVFGGASTANPFEHDAGTSSYVGGTDSEIARIAPGVAVVTGLRGSDVFQHSNRQATVWMGETGLAVGSGATTLRETATVAVRHTQTTFSGTGGLSAGVSTARDTIVGAVGTHSLTLHDDSGTGSSGTLSLNGGPPVAFTSADTDLVVTGPRGEVVHVDTTAVIPGFHGNVALSATGSVSIDAGLTETPLDFTSRQAILDSRTGEVLSINSVGVHSTGVDEVEFTGTADAFQTLRRLALDLRNTRQLSTTDRDAALARRLQDLERHSNHLLTMVGEQSLGLEQLEHVENRLSEELLEARSRLAELNDTDYPQAILELQTRQMQLQFSLAAAARLFDVSLLNFLS